MAWLIWGWGQGLEGIKVSVPRAWLFPLKRLESPVLGLLCVWSTMLLRGPVFSVQHGFISLVLAVSHCVIFFTDSGPFLPWKCREGAALLTKLACHRT